MHHRKAFLFPRGRCRPAAAHGQDGLALVAVLWITAALAILVMSLSQTTRTDTRVVQVHKERVIARNVADGAVQVAGRWLTLNGDEAQRPVTLTATIGEHEVEIDVTPVTGLIDLNHATPALLEQMFVVAAGLSTPEARRLAERIAIWRDQDESTEDAGWPADALPPRYGPFYTVEDLRQVPGVTPAIYDNVSRLLVAHWSVHRSVVSPVAARRDVLLVLSGGDQAGIDRLIAGRAEQAGEPDTSMLNGEFIGRQGASAFRLDVRLVFPADRTYRRTAWVNLAPRSRGVTPWHVWQVEPLRSVARD